MDKATAHGLVPFTNDPSFQLHFTAFIEQREKLLLDRLISADTTEKLVELRSAIKELRHVKTINAQVKDFIQTSRK